MNVSEVKTAAILENFNDPGTSADFITPTMYCRWINESVTEIWRLLVAMNPQLYAFIGKTIAVVAGTAEYNLDADVQSISAMQIRTGSAGSYTYANVLPLQNNRRYYAAMQGYPFANSSSPYFRWMEGGSGIVLTAFRRKVIFTPTPSADCTVVYNGQRKPVDVSIPPADETLAIVDLPDDLFHNLVKRVEKKAMVRDKVRTDEIDAEIKALDLSMMLTYNRGLQNQTSVYTERS